MYTTDNTVPKSLKPHKKQPHTFSLVKKTMIWFPEYIFQLIRNKFFTIRI